MINDGFKPFITENNIDFRVTLCETDNVEDINTEKEKTVFSNNFFSVKSDDNGYYRIFHDHKEADRCYACGRFVSDEEEKIRYLRDSQRFFCETHNTFSHIALEEILLKRDAMILHASFIDTAYGGILFSGPSGIGKSTQADLWVQGRNARLINGDRTILRKNSERWDAYGSPYAGSSQCYINEAKRITAIVMLEQAESCKIMRLKERDAFIRLYAGMIVNTWNKEYVKKMSMLIEEVVKEIPVYLFSCTADENAVEMLEKTLKKGADNGKR